MLPPLDGMPRRLALVGLAALGLGVAIGFGNLLAARAPSPWAPHAAAHASMAAVVALGAFAGWRIHRSPRAPRDALGRAGSLLALGGAAALVLALLAEAALAPRGDGSLPHAAAQRAVALALLPAALGAFVWTLAGTQARLLPRWALIPMALVLGVALAGAARTLF